MNKTIFGGGIREGNIAWHFLFVFVTWLIRMCNMMDASDLHRLLADTLITPPEYSAAYTEPLVLMPVCVAWHIHTCDMTHS